MESNKINYLNKDEIFYELKIRGVPCDFKNPVDLLRKQLRQHFLMPTDVCNLTDQLIVKQEINILNTKFETLKNLLENPDISSPMYVARVNAKINHLTLRVNSFKKCKNLKPEDELSVKEFISKLTDMQSTHEHSLSQATTVSQEEMDKFDNLLNTSLIEEEETTLRLLNLEGPPSPVLPVNNPSTVSQNLVPPNISHEVDRDSTNNLVTRSDNHVSNNSMFSKLSNPLEKLLQNFKPCDGLDINSLLHFLRNLVKITSETNLTQTELYDLLPNYSEGPLLNKIISFKQTGLPIKQLHQDILTTFVPITLKQRLIQDLVYRPQFHHEPLASYISEIKTNSLILKVHHSEKELVAFIKNGLHPEVRSKLVFEQNPVTFADLDMLCINSNNIAYNDYLRDSVAYKNLQPRPNLSLESRQGRNTSIANVRSQGANQKTCYLCNKIGHLARNCWNKNTSAVPKNG